MLVGMTALALLLWPTDALIYGTREELFEAITFFRLTVVAAGVLGWLLVTFVPPFRSRAAIVFMLGSSLVLAIIGALFARGGGFDTPHVYGVFALPFMTVLLVVRLPLRIVATVLITSSFIAGYLLTVTDAGPIEYGIQGGAYTLSTLVSSIVIGHYITSLLMANFFRHQLLEDRAEQLSERNQEKQRIVEEVTRELKKKEKQVIQLQRLEAVAHMSGGVAHEFNNILTVILANAAFVKAELDRNHPCYELTEDIVESGHRAAALIQQLLAFSRELVLETHTSDLNDVLRESIGTLRPAISDSVVFEIRFSPDPLPVSTDRHQLGQVITHVVMNAVDAMSQEGTISVETSLLEPGAEELAWLPEHQDRGFARLTVRDEGRGMDEETRQRAFEPFFTTKEVGEGTGLGLSMVYGYVTQLGGAVRLESKEEEGTTVTICLPLHRDDTGERSSAE